MRTVAMLSTSDNPFNPFDDYQEWFAWDLRAGYNTPGMLARIAIVSPEQSEVDQSIAIEDAIDEIVEHNALGVYIKLTKEIED